MMRVLGQPQAVHSATGLLGNPLRLAILNLLREGSKPRHEIAERLGVSQSNLSRQLSMLDEAGLIQSTTLPGRGRPVEYRIDDDAVEAILTLIGDYVRGIESHPGD